MGAAVQETRRAGMSQVHVYNQQFTRRVRRPAPRKLESGAVLLRVKAEYGPPARGRADQAPFAPPG